MTFHNRYGITLAADLYEPKEASGKLAAIAVSGPFGAVKEQAAGLYAQTMAERGFLTIAFDPSFTGESGGQPRYVASPDLLSLVVCSIAGYGFEIYHDRVKDGLMSVLLLALIVPFAATLIPLFKLFTGIHLQSTWIAYVLPTISTPFLIMLFRQSARSFPMEIIEAARIDGLSELRIFFTIFIPTMRSTYAAAMTVTFMNVWNNL